MTHALIKAAGISLLLALGACAQTQTEAAAPAATSQTVAATPSPRAECAPAHVTLYFGEQLSSDEPVVTPLLNDFMGRVRACEAAGGELRSITVSTTADPGQSPGDARAQVRRRVERVRAALVNAGAPADKIVEGAAETSPQVMGRRAEITADLY
jgi:outer membrane protein OmpA-like peptidoglycan-associated protein